MMWEATEGTKGWGLGAGAGSGAGAGTAKDEQYVVHLVFCGCRNAIEAKTASGVFETTSAYPPV
jgi:hypothetical protein